jgi:hypothetical protein
MCRLPACLLIAAAATALLSCGAPQATAPAASAAYEPPGAVERAPLAPLPGETSAPMSISPPPAGTGSGSADAASAQAGSGKMIWKASPRWAEVRGNDKLDGDQAN